MGTRKITVTLLVCLALSPVPGARAWNDHAVPTYFALREMPAVAQAAPVTVETLDDFLRVEQPAIAALLSDQESWATAHFADFPARPAALAFRAEPNRDDESRRLAFFHALRIAANLPFALYLIPDLPPGLAPVGAAMLPMSAVSTLPQPADAPPVIALTPGDKVSPLSVIATAAGEPDNGVDINCWDDSPAAWGKTYGFGALPFGNPALSFSTQAPFHMGFYHESPVLMALDPVLKRTYPALRAHQFSTLAELAFRTGHDYWGWRFSGMALHYVQDATQPYHAHALPNVPIAKFLAFHALTMTGRPERESAVIVLASNRHMVLELYAQELLRTEQANAALIQALGRGDLDEKYPAWADREIENVVTAKSAAVADRLDAVLAQAMPAKYVADPSYDFGAAGDRVDLIAAVAGASPAQRAALDQIIVDRFASFGTHTRRALRAIIRESPSH